MFVFGTPEDQAATYWDAVRQMGPGVPEHPLEEMTVEELRSTQVLAGMAWKNAKIEGATQEVLDMLSYECWLIAFWQITHDDQARALAAEGKFNPRGVRTSQMTELARDLNRKA